MRHASCRRITNAVLLRVRLGVARLLRLNASPHGVAFGFTLGFAFSLIPIPFLGMVLALLLAPFVGASLPAVYAGTAIVNPLTGAAFYFGELALGGWMIGMEFPGWNEVRRYDWREWWGLFKGLLPAFLLGALTCMAAGSIIAYPTVRWLVAAYQRRKTKAKTKASTPLARTTDRHQHAEREHHRDHVGSAVGEERQGQPGVGEEFEDDPDVEHRMP